MPERGKPRVSFFVSARFTQKGGSDKKEAGALKIPFVLFCFVFIVRAWKKAKKNERKKTLKTRETGLYIQHPWRMQRAPT